MQFAPRKLGFRPSCVIASVSDWMRRAAGSGQPITPGQVEAWAAAFDTAERRAREIEALATAKPLSLEEQRAFLNDHAARLVAQACSRAIDHLADLARDAATHAELEDIDRTVVSLRVGLMALATGFDRPQSQQGNPHAS